MYISQDISARIKILAKNKGIQIKEMLSACNLGVNTLANMNSGRMPLSDSVGKIADYLDCSVDYLLGRTENKNASAEGKLSEGNVVRLAGRDGSYFEKVLPDDLYEILKKFIDSLDEDHDPRL